MFIIFSAWSTRSERLYVFYGRNSSGKAELIYLNPRNINIPRYTDCWSVPIPIVTMTLVVWNGDAPSLAPHTVDKRNVYYLQCMVESEWPFLRLNPCKMAFPNGQSNNIINTIPWITNIIALPNGLGRHPAKGPYHGFSTMTCPPF